MDTSIIKSPTTGTIEMLNRRRALSKPLGEYGQYDTIGLVQGKLIEMVTAGDVAEKAANVFVEEIRGLCPQHFSMLAIFGDTSSVEAAIDAVIQRFMKE
jgi:ethanolamine utilization microcompartment shell protein EutS